MSNHFGTLHHGQQEQKQMGSSENLDWSEKALREESKDTYFDDDDELVSRQSNKKQNRSRRTLFIILFILFTSFFIYMEHIMSKETPIMNKILKGDLKEKKEFKDLKIVPNQSLNPKSSNMISQKFQDRNQNVMGQIYDLDKDKLQINRKKEALKEKESQQSDMNQKKEMIEENGKQQVINQLNNLNVRNYTFSVKSNQFTANIKTKRAVTNVNETLVQGLSYLRETQTDIITFPQKDWEVEEFIPLKINNSLQKDKEIEIIMKDENKSFAFFKNLFLNPQKQSLLQKEYLLYEKYYNISLKKKEIEMCVVGTGKNLFLKKMQNNFLSSLNRQNYTNFKVFYVDDASNDKTTLKAYELVATKYQKLKSKITFLRNKQSVNAFSNKDSTMKQHCSNQSVIIDIDLDDAIIGNQVFNIINAVYSSNKDLWVVHTKFLKNRVQKNIVKNFGIFIEQGFSSSLQVPAAEYRRSGVKFHTSHLKTYRAFLEHKIPTNYLMELHKVGNEQRLQYHRYASDSTTIYSLFQLAGDKRIKFLPFWVYFYEPNPSESRNQCHIAHQKYDQKRFRNFTTLEPLENSNAEPKKTEKQKDINVEEFLLEEINICKAQYEKQCSLMS